MNRSALGVVSLVLFVVGTIMMAGASGEGDLGGVLIRASVVLGAVWLVLPNARRVHRSVWAAVGSLAVFLIVAPRLILWGIGVSAILSAFGFLVRRRDRPDAEGHRRPD